MRDMQTSISTSGGIIDLRGPYEETAGLIERITSEVLAFGNIDQRSAIAPVTNGTAKLVPLISMYPPPEDVLVIFIPGAISPRCFLLMDRNLILDPVVHSHYMLLQE